MTAAEIETVYDAMASALDDIGEDRRNLFLAKLALLLSHDLGDVDLACRRISEAGQDLNA